MHRIDVITKHIKVEVIIEIIKISMILLSYDTRVKYLLASYKVGSTSKYFYQ